MCLLIIASSISLQLFCNIRNFDKFARFDQVSGPHTVQTSQCNESIKPSQCNQSIKPSQCNKSIKPSQCNKSIKSAQCNESIISSQCNKSTNNLYFSQCLLKWTSEMSHIMFDDFIWFFHVCIHILFQGLYVLSIIVNAVPYFKHVYVCHV